MKFAVHVVLRECVDLASVEQALKVIYTLLETTVGRTRNVLNFVKSECKSILLKPPLSVELQ